MYAAMGSGEHWQKVVWASLALTQMELKHYPQMPVSISECLAAGMEG